MARQIEVAAIPNQSFALTLDGHRYSLELKEASGVMVASVSRDDVVLAQGVRLVAGELMLPYAYLSDANFALYTENEELPDWQAFGATQFLYYLGADEVASLRNG